MEWVECLQISYTGMNILHFQKDQCLRPFFLKETAFPGYSVVTSANGMHAQSRSCVQLFATPWTATCQASLSMGFPRQEYWSGSPFLQGVFLTQGSNLHLLHWQIIDQCANWETQS